MAFERHERTFLESSRVARLASIGPAGIPHAVPICFALDGTTLASALDEKPKTVAQSNLQRVRNIRSNPAVSVLIDRYTERWDDLAWVRIDGQATLVMPGSDGHRRAVCALRDKYDQYATHAIDDYPVIAITPDKVVSWGALEVRGD